MGFFYALVFGRLGVFHRLGGEPGTRSKVFCGVFFFLGGGLTPVAILLDDGTLLPPIRGKRLLAVADPRFPPADPRFPPANP